MTQPQLDAGNHQLVSRIGDHVIVQMPKSYMSRAEALAHAAWLASIADPVGDDFAEVLAAVQSS